MLHESGGSVHHFTEYSGFAFTTLASLSPQNWNNSLLTTLQQENDAFTPTGQNTGFLRQKYRIYSISSSDSSAYDKEQRCVVSVLAHVDSLDVCEHDGKRGEKRRCEVSRNS